MVFLKKDYIELSNKKRKCSWFSCDQCNIKYYKLGHSEILRKNITFCNKKCFYLSKTKNGVRYKDIQKVILKKYGVKNISQSEIIKNKKEETCIKNFNKRNPMYVSSIIEKRNRIFFKKYNVINPFQNDKIKEKIKQTLQKKYGVLSPAHCVKIQAKKRKTCQKRYGENYTFASEKIRNKIKQTNLKRYGVTNPVHSEPIKKKIEKTNLERYGCRSPFGNKNIRNKIHQTKKKNKSYGKSKEEDKYYKYLCLKYGSLFIERQKHINGWNIDFYVKSKDLYIQFDGDYWHGLNKDIKEIKKSFNIQSKSIYNTMIRDIKQNKWFKENNKKLIRIRECDFKKGIIISSI